MVSIFTVNGVIPVTDYGRTFLINLKKNVFPEVKNKNIHNFPSLFTFLTSKWNPSYARAWLMTKYDLPGQTEINAKTINIFYQVRKRYDSYLEKKTSGNDVSWR